MAFPNLQAMFKLAERPVHTISSRKGEDFEIKTDAKNALLFVKDCTDCHGTLLEKAAKLLVEDCENLVLDVKNTFLSGLLELVSCQKVVLNLLEGGQIPTIMADSTTDLTINVLESSQFGSLYLHQSGNIEVCKLGEDPDKHSVEFPENTPMNFQFVVHWEKDGESEKLVCEKVVREGVFPTTERKLKEDQERTARDLEKMATALVDGIKILPKGQQKGKPSPGSPESKSKGKPRKPPAASGSKPKPKPGSNISSEIEKKEYFDSEGALAEKTVQLAKWIRESNYCIMFTGAGVSTSTGIPDFRSGMNTVLPTGPGIWERKAKGVQLPSQKKKTLSVLQAIPSPSHMAIVKLQEEGLVKFVVSQNTDGLHQRSGLDPAFLAELHGNTNMEKCIKCGMKYMRDFRTRTSREVHNHLTGRHCDDLHCGGHLVDSIINFNEDLPEDELEKAFNRAEFADLCIVLGSSLRVYPAADIPGDMIKRGAKVVIVNLQKTPLNTKCAMEVHSRIDSLIVRLMKQLELEIPPFKLKRCCIVHLKSDTLTIQGLDTSTNKKPYSFIKAVTVELPALGSTTDLKKEPFGVKVAPNVVPSEEAPVTVNLTLVFWGHYGEPEIKIRHKIISRQPTMFLLQFDVTKGEWQIEKQSINT
ncbi:uncharacterized protein [Acropora muricata]|uniref:uncharacterized protein isoform X2 n=1 Tax=Acropora muricata TaxID=159855 RepID=UPI0034E51D91